MQGVQVETNMKPKSKKRWSLEEDLLLKNSIQANGTNWINVSLSFTDRNPSQCAQRWKRIGNRIPKQVKWTKKEDEIILKAVAKYNKQWTKLAKFLPNRNARQIRERFVNHLNKGINRDPWSKEEDQLIWDWTFENGTKWSKLAKILKSRPENSIKNRYYGYVRQQYGKIANPYYIVSNANNNNSIVLEEKTHQEQEEKMSQVEDNGFTQNFLNTPITNYESLVSEIEENLCFEEDDDIDCLSIKSKRIFPIIQRKWNF